MVSYASVVGSLMNAKDRTYPDIVHISGLFWQCLVQLYITRMELSVSASCYVGKIKFSQKAVSAKIEFVKCVAKSTIVTHFHTWSFCVEMLQRVKQLSSM
jgi:hypothetical protein